MVWGTGMRILRPAVSERLVSSPAAGYLPGVHQQRESPVLLTLPLSVPVDLEDREAADSAEHR
jgi:hypothetical protein